MTKLKKWNKGDPPHIGWWECKHKTLLGIPIKVWRWWNGRCWSYFGTPSTPLKIVKWMATQKSIQLTEEIKWSTYWPKNARVPRVKP